MVESPLIVKSKQMIESTKGKTFSLDERKKAAIQLAAWMLEEAQNIQTRQGKKVQKQLARMMGDPIGKVFTTAMTDQCFRSSSPSRVANQLVYLLKKYGIPRFLNTNRRLELFAFKVLGRTIPGLLVPTAKHMLRKETSSVILPGEPKELVKHMQKRRDEGVRINLNHLGEAILGEEEAQKRLQVYLEDLAKPEVEYVSVKISTIYSQLNLLDWEQTLQTLADRLRLLYRAAEKHKYRRQDGQLVPKFVNLDMEEYRDLHLTVELFCQLLEEPEFLKHSAGIVLQSYLPDSFALQQQLTEWALKRLSRGGAPIKIRIVKGANLAMEQVEASLKGWPQAPYNKKSDVDANYKRMVAYGCQKEHAKAANLGIASHNLFDIAYALLLRAESGVESYVCFEMLEGMADHMRKVVQALAGDMLLYCPAASKEEFQNAVAYLVRRLDENTAPENFLRHAFDLRPSTPEWRTQANFFSKGCDQASSVSAIPRRFQNRLNKPSKPCMDSPFENEADTDWALVQNRQWAEEILESWSNRKLSDIPLVIGGKTFTSKNLASRQDLANPDKALYRYSLAGMEEVHLALETAKQQEEKWGKTSLQERSALLANVAQLLREQRGELIGAMVADTAKTVAEADAEISEAIDFAEYYWRNAEEIATMKDLRFKPKGTILVTPPWNFPCSIPAGGILAALATGNCVIFKPAPESVFTGWLLAQIFWAAGISKDVLQWITCEDEPVGSSLIQDPRISAVVLTGATATAKLFLKMRPGLDLMAETGGKNSLIITALSDRDLAIKDLVQSAFGYSGQKCSACSLAILEKEVYDCPQFRQQLRDAAESWFVGQAWNLRTRLNPLIREPNPTLLRGLTTLDEGEEWLLKPKQDPHYPNLWSPGIKLGVKEGSFSHQNEFFGPVLSLMKAEDLKQAIQFANGTPYGLTSGIHSLDDREQTYWIQHIEAGNCYINRGITGAIVQRQPFGGCKESSFGRGSKAGGPNYVSQFWHVEQEALPKEQDVVPISIQLLTNILEEEELNLTQLNLWKISMGNYAFYWNNYFSKNHDPSQLVGEDNILRYLPHTQLMLRIQHQDRLIDVLRAIAAAHFCGSLLEISVEPSKFSELFSSKKLSSWLLSIPQLKTVQETEKQLIQRISQREVHRIRLLAEPSKELRVSLGLAACNVILAPVLANGRLELLNYLREMSLSVSYHRYGNLGEREGEKRRPLVEGNVQTNAPLCETCGCHGSV